MELEHRLAILKSLYRIYDETVADFDTACGQHCATCCTCNVTCTTLEGWLVFDHLRSHGGIEPISRLVAEAPDTRYRPAITLNHMVAICLQGRELPQEDNDPRAGACPLLEVDLCSLYAVRPFGCRAMLSTHDCTRGGEARMPPYILSLNNVMMQYIEAIDRPGGWGNLIDVLGFFVDEVGRQGYEDQTCHSFKSPLKTNRPFSVLMIPPEHRERMRPLIKRIQTLVS